MLKARKYYRLLNDYFQRSKIFELTIFITSACNFRCSHCFYWDKLNKVNALTLEEFKELACKTPPMVRLGFTGGEPFMRKDIDEIVSVFYRNTKPSYITIPSNGYFTDIIEEKTREILKNSPDAFVNISLSLDDLGERRDRFVEKKGSFQNLLNTISSLKELKNEYSNLGITTITTQSADNQDRLDEIFDYAVHNLEVDNFGFAVVRGTPKSKDSAIVDEEKYIKMCNKISKYYRNKKANDSVIPLRGVYLANRDIVYKYTYKTLKENSYQLKCYAGIKRGVVLENGDVFPCEILMDQGKEFLIGNLRDYNMDFLKLWNSKRHEEIILKIKEKLCFCTHGCDMSINTFHDPKCTIELISRVFSSYIKR
jgi:radical SAM protein with 4Fe4S-binding SPASM domain